MHVVWIHEKADLVGGAERYVYETAGLLADRGVRSTLLYGVDGWTEPAFTGRFDAAFPWVDGERQLDALAPDVVYVHQCADPVAIIDTVARVGVPALRFLHDHALFCPRDHKYTTLGHRTCTRTVGLGCYPCLGFLNRAEGPLPIRIRTPGAVLAEQRRHMELTGVVVGSRYMHDHATAHGFPASHVHVNPLYVRPPESSGEATRRDGELLFVGALLRGKGIDILLEAMRILPERVTLRLAGDGHQRAMFERMARELGVAHRTEFLGRLGTEDLVRAYAEAACVVIPSRQPETFAFAGPEALVHGTPVVASDIGGVREWLEPDVTGLAVPSCDPQALAAAVRRLLDAPDLARRLGEAGRRRVLEEMTPEQHVERLLALFGRVGRA